MFLIVFLSLSIKISAKTTPTSPILNNQHVNCVYENDNHLPYYNFYNKKNVKPIKIIITITLKWGRKSRNCKGFGICFFVDFGGISVESKNKKSKFYATNEGGHLKLIITDEGKKEIEKYFGKSMVILGEDVPLPKGLIEVLKLEQKVLKAGTYSLKKQKSKYGNSSIVF